MAERAEVARGRTLAVLRHLATLGIVSINRTPYAAIYRIDDSSPLAPALRSLFLWERDMEDAP